MAAKTYRVLKRSFINNGLVEPGQIVEYDPGKDGTIGDNLELVSAKEAKDSPTKRELAPNNVQPNGPAAEPASPITTAEPLA
jgi:hypothetical protein